MTDLRHFQPPAEVPRQSADIRGDGRLLFVVSSPWLGRMERQGMPEVVLGHLTEEVAKAIWMLAHFAKAKGVTVHLRVDIGP